MPNTQADDDDDNDPADAEAAAGANAAAARQADRHAPAGPAETAGKAAAVAATVLDIVALPSATPAHDVL